MIQSMLLWPVMRDTCRVLLLWSVGLLAMPAIYESSRSALEAALIPGPILDHVRRTLYAALYPPSRFIPLDASPVERLADMSTTHLVSELIALDMNSSSEHFNFVAPMTVAMDILEDLHEGPLERDLLMQVRAMLTSGAREKRRMMRSRRGAALNARAALASAMEHEGVGRIIANEVFIYMDDDAHIHVDSPGNVPVAPSRASVQTPPEPPPPPPPPLEGTDNTALRPTVGN